MTATVPATQTATQTATQPQDRIALAQKAIASVEIPRNSRMPEGMAEKLEMARTLLKSGMCPPSFKSAEAVFVVLQYGDELGLSPLIALQNIANIQNRPAPGAMIMYGVAQSNGLVERMEFVEDGQSCVVRGYRRGDPVQKEGRFSVEDAKRAGLLGKTNWQSWTPDMLVCRAVTRFLKRACPEIFGGMVSREEVEDVVTDAPAVAPPAWTMDRTKRDHISAVANACKVPPGDRKAIVAKVTGARKVESADGVAQYTQAEYGAIVEALKAWRPAEAESKPAAAPAPEPQAQSKPAEGPGPSLANEDAEPPEGFVGGQ